MNPYDRLAITKEQLQKYEGFENMTDEELDMALSVIYTVSCAYLNNKEKIIEYERSKFREV